jgi:hypothetical protein
VVFLAEALERLHGVNVVGDARERILALETPGGELLPLIENLRAGAFRKDERLRELSLELLSQQHEGVPLLEIVRIFEVRDGVRYELDYWCEICAIAMYELKECECCQGPIELRRREVDAGGRPLPK